MIDLVHDGPAQMGPFQIRGVAVGVGRVRDVCATPVFDFGGAQWDKSVVKTAKTAAEKKTPGTVAVEKHRPLMNKLTVAERRRLRRRAAELLYGREALAPGR